MQEGTKRVGVNTLHSAEFLVAGSAAGYAAGRFSDVNNEWGFRNIPYLYLGGGFALVAGLIASAQGGATGGRYGADLMAIGSGIVGAELFPAMREAGINAKTGATTTGVPRALRARSATVPPMAARRPARVPMGTAFDAVA